MIERRAALDGICKDIPEINSDLSESELQLQLKEETSFGESWLNFDSIDMVELIMLLEERFDVVIDDALVDNVVTVSDLIDAVVEAGR